MYVSKHAYEYVNVCAPVCMCMDVCLYVFSIYLCVHMYVYMCRYVVYVFVCAYVNMYAGILYVCVFLCVCTHPFMCIRVC